MTSANQHKPVKRGPQIGAPPSLEQVPVDRLTVDATYQRATDTAQSRRIIVGMVKAWDWALCQPLVVSRRDNGALLILDGQHRHKGAIERGDIPYLPCTILSSLDHAGEARTFVELNTKRQKLSQRDVFHGLLAAGDTDAIAVQQLLEETGWTIASGSGTNHWKPGQLECAPMLVTALKTKGRPTVRFGLTVLRAAYPETSVRQSATLLKALFELFDAAPEAIGNAAALIATIGSTPTEQWISRGIIHHARNAHLTNSSALSAVILMALRGEEPPSPRSVSTTPGAPAPIGTNAIAPSYAKPAVPAPTPAPPRTFAPEPARRAPPKPANPFGMDGKGWCSQCEQIRSRPAAAACESRFCKLRSFT